MLEVERSAYEDCQEQDMLLMYGQITCHYCHHVQGSLAQRRILDRPCLMISLEWYRFLADLFVEKKGSGMGR